MATRDELLAGNVAAAAASVRKREDQLRQTRRDFRSRVAKFVEFDGGIFYRLS